MAACLMQYTLRENSRVGHCTENLYTVYVAGKLLNTSDWHG